MQFLAKAVGGMWGTPAWWNNNVYFGSSRDYLKQFTFNPTTGLLSTTRFSESPTSFGFPGPTPSISANGNTNGIVWALEKDSILYKAPGTLHAYDAANVANELYNSDQNGVRDSLGEAVKFAVPTVANGKVYVPTVKQLTVYGLLGKDRQSRK